MNRLIPILLGGAALTVTTGCDDAKDALEGEAAAKDRRVAIDVAVLKETFQDPEYATRLRWIPRAPVGVLEPAPHNSPYGF